MSAPVIVRLVALAVIATSSALPLVANEQTTTTATFSSQAGTINASFIWTHETIGPATISVGTLTGCTLVGSPPFAGCVLGSGTGTVADPFGYSCSGAPPLTGCGGGTPFTVPGGGNNFDARLHQVFAADAASVAVPIDPWVAFASAAGVLLAVLRLRKRRC